MSHKASILIVEDEAVVAADLAGKIERAGYRLLGTAPRGEAAIELARIEAPDLVLMDIRLAGQLDGVETADRLRTFLNIPIVYLTAHSDAETLKRAKQTEPFGYILKPFDERDLTTQIEIALYRHQAEILLRDSEARYRSLVETAMDSIVMIDRKGTILSCNSATERMFGYDRMDMLERNVSMLMPPPYPDDGAGASDSASEFPVSRVIGQWRELKGRRRDGSIVPIEVAFSRTELRGQTHFTGIIRDISERRKAEAEIRWRADLLEQAHEAVIVWRMGGGIVYWSKGAAELYEWTAEEASGRAAHELLNTTLPMPALEFDKWLLEAGGWYGEIRQSKKDGTTVIVESRMTTVSDGSGGILVMETNRDVTERHDIHEKVCRLAEELDQRVKERTKDLLLSQERLRALATELSLTEQRERKRLATELHDHLAQLLVLGRLKLSQAKRMPIADPACASFIAQTSDVLDESLRYTRTLVADLSPPVLHDFGLPTALRWLSDYMRRYDLTVTIMLGDPHAFTFPEDQAVLLFQSVRELLMNVHKHAETDEATVSVSHQNGAVRIEVRDKGKGFDFITTEASDSVPSSRFGLFSIRERMSALGGSFQLDSTPGQGTTVTLTLPFTNVSSGISQTSNDEEMTRVHSEMAQPFTQSAVSFRNNDSGLTADISRAIRVLLVDDHALVRQGLRSLLEQYPDVEIVGEAADGMSAVSMALSMQPDVVVMDVNMPEMDGVEATLRIKAEHPATIVIGLSMHNSGHYEATMRKAGAAAYLSKDSVSDHLHATMLACRLDGDHFTLQQEKAT